MELNAEIGAQTGMIVKTLLTIQNDTALLNDLEAYREMMNYRLGKEIEKLKKDIEKNQKKYEKMNNDFSLDNRILKVLDDLSNVTVNDP